LFELVISSTYSTSKRSKAYSTSGTSNSTVTKPGTEI